MGQPETLSVSLNEHVAVITMDRPQKLNAMNRQFFRELPEVMHELAEAGTRAAVLTGAGRAFSAGGDIEMFPDLMGNTAAVRPHLRAVFDAFHSLQRAPFVVIGAVNGIAHGGGLEITLACDWALASTDATFAFREASLGLIPGYGLTRGPAVIGQPWTTRLAATAEIIDANRAAQIGLVTDVVDPSALTKTALDQAATVAGNSQTAVDTAKRFLQRDSDEGLSGAVESTAIGFHTLAASDAVDSFLNRRGS